MRELALDRFEKPRRIGLPDESNVRQIADGPGREDDDGNAGERRVFEETPPEKPAVDARHLQIHHDERNRVPAEIVERGLAVTGRHHYVALEMEQPNQRVPCLVVVVDDQNGKVRHRVANHE